MEIQTIKKDFNPTSIILMIKILNIKANEYYNLSDLARDLNITAGHPTFQNVIPYLLEQGIITIHNTVGTSKLIHIKHKELKNLLDEQEHINFIVDYYLKTWHTFIW